jgi:hypothetical protein
MDEFTCQKTENGWVVYEGGFHQRPHMESRTWVFTTNESLATWIKDELPKLTAGRGKKP